MINIEETGLRIKEKIFENNLSVQEVYCRLGISPMAVYKWLNGTCLPKTDHLYELSRMCNCSMEDLLIIEGD